mmetsp:Transcript_12408/g.16935  ORF Transcript_12408/g.16935 Transcript_12408/m.16935 type:complete len:110 (+) Transcript_12408:1403-1732(+)
MLTVDKIMSVLRGKGIHTAEGSSVIQEPRKRKVNDVEEDLSLQAAILLSIKEIEKYSDVKYTRQRLAAVRAGGFNIKQCSGDGNCFLHAIKDQLEFLKQETGSVSIQEL